MPALSTLALLRVLTRLAAKSKSRSIQKNSEQRLVWRGALEGILRTFVEVEEQSEWSIVIDPEAEVVPGIPVQSSHRVRLPLTRGAIDLQPLFECDEFDVSEFMVDTFAGLERKDAVGLVDFCCLLDETGKRGAWLLGQAIYQITNMVESAILQHEVDSDDESDFADLKSEEDGLIGGRRDRTKIAQQRVRRRCVKRAKNYDPRLAMLALFFCMRAAFSKSRVIHYACDASTVALKDRLLGFITAAGTPGAWLPPTVAARKQYCCRHVKKWHRLAGVQRKTRNAIFLLYMTVFCVKFPL